MGGVDSATIVLHRLRFQESRVAVQWFTAMLGRSGSPPSPRDYNNNNKSHHNNMTLILTESRTLRFFSFTVFYLAQGLPFGLVLYALPAFLAERGWEISAITSFVAIAQLPWSFKLLAGPMMDRFSLLAMGRRRPWVIFSQLALVLVGVTFMFFPGGLDDAVVLTALCFLLNSFAAMQDVAVDGMAIDVLPANEQGRANGFMALGQVMGSSGSTAISAFVLTTLGLYGVALMLVVGFGLILGWSIVVRERAGEKLLPWTEGEATARSKQMQAQSWKQIGVDLLKVLLLPGSLLVMGGSFLFLLGHTFWIALTQIIVVQDLGIASTEYSSWTAISTFIAAIAGLLVGLFIDRRGVKLFYLLMLGCYGVLAIAVGLLEASWQLPAFLLSIAFIQAFIYQGAFVSFIAIHMNLCWVKVAATQFALYMAWVNLGRSLGPKMLSTLQPYLAKEQMFFAISACFFLAVVLLWKLSLQTHQQRVTELR